MEIFQSEIDCGIGELLKNNSVAFSSAIKNIATQPTKETLLGKLEDKLFQAIAKVGTQPDLLYRNAILASIGWNKNDDVFDKLETWKARETPVDKQVNFMHNELDIIGHITNSIALSRNGQELIVPSEDNLPDDFDIAVGFVLYKQWENPERQALLDNIVEQIDTNKWFVSMECRFDKFDYAIIDKNGLNRVIARTKDTAFLSKYLRVYGGSGVYQNCRIGRLFRDFYFVGKGIVDNPANERSIIYGEKPDKFISIGSLDIKGINMDLEARVKELESQLAEAAKQAETKAQAEIAQALETAKADSVRLNGELEAAKVACDKAVNELAESKDANSVLTVKLEEATAKVNELTVSIAKSNRINKLVSVGVEAAKAEEIYTKWASATDEQFADIVELHSKAKCDDKDMKKMDEKKEEAAKDEDKKEDKKEEAKADFDAAKEEKSVAFTQVDEETKNDIKSLASLLTRTLPYASKASARREQSKVTK